MPRLALALVLVLVLAAIAAPAAAQPAGPTTSTPVAWLERPSADDIIAAIPVEAARQGISGSATIRCRVTTDGVAQDCEVVSESREGLGFGAAAVLLSRQFLLRPATQDGVPIASTMSTTIRFDLEGMRGRRDTTTYVTAATWLRAPSRAEMDAVFPDPERGEEGRAVLDCRVTDDGELTRCETIAETPSGRGFGRAARRLTDRFQMAPVAGVDMENLRIQLPFQFDLPGTPPGEGERTVMTNPEWRSLPDVPSVLETFPAAARAQGVTEGRVSVSCAILADGSTSDCTVAGPADPPGLGFEEAALVLARLFAVNPWTADGRPFQSERIRIPFRFVDPELEAEPDTP